MLASCINRSLQTHLLRSQVNIYSLTMLRYLQQVRDSLSSPDSFKKSLQTSTGNGEVRYNADLLPSPPG
jgi:hypothetical protein